MPIELLRSWQLPRKKREEFFIGEAEWGWGGGREGSTGLACHSCQSIDHNGNSSYLKHKFQNKTGLDAKDNSELYKSKQVNSADKG